MVTNINKIDTIGDLHVGTSKDTPMKKDAFEMSDEDKIKKIEQHFKEIMDTLGLDLTDDSLSGTPHRIAKMYVKEIFSGLDPKNRPSVSVFENKYDYNNVLVEKDILLQSCCEHHFIPFIGKCHVAYIPNEKVVGLSKLNRIVRYYARRPQVQERLTIQIAEDLKKTLNTEDVAVYIEAKHLCVAMRGVEDNQSSTVTSHYSGRFAEGPAKAEFLQAIQ